MTTTTATSDEYNGWSNRETWAAHLHITNDEYASEAVLNDIYEYLDDRHARWTPGLDFPVVSFATEAVSEFFERWIDQFMDDCDAVSVANIASDVGSRWRVDWQAVARALIEDADIGT